MLVSCLVDEHGAARMSLNINDREGKVFNRFERSIRTFQGC